MQAVISVQWFKSGKQKTPADEPASDPAVDPGSEHDPTPTTSSRRSLRTTAARVRARKDAVAAETGPWPHKEVATKKTLLVVAAVALACGPLALVRAHALVTDTQPTHNGLIASVSPGEQRQAEWVATEFFTQWATATSATQASLLSQVTNPPANPTFPQTAAPAPASVQVVSADQPQPGLWQIIVHARGGSFADGAWYMVPVDVTTTSVAIDALPSPVGGLATTPTPTTINQVDPASAPGQTAAGLVLALLNGGNTATLARWTVPNYTPAPLGQLCTTTTITGITTSAQDQSTLTNATAAAIPSTPTSSSPTPAPLAGQSVHAVVTVTAACNQPHTTRLVSYRIGLTTTGGQWAVDQVN